MNLLPHQQRVVEERQELEVKIDKLRSFIPTDTCLSLPFAERTRLARQLKIMLDYSEVLAERIEAFVADSETV